jgi:hypothetical protein
LTRPRVCETVGVVEGRDSGPNRHVASPRSMRFWIAVVLAGGLLAACAPDMTGTVSIPTTPSAAPGQHILCQLAQILPFTVAGDPSKSPPVWGIDRFGRAFPVIWPPGFRARFTPRLEVLAPDGPTLAHRRAGWSAPLRFVAPGSATGSPCARNSIASTIWRRGMRAGAPRRPGGSKRSATRFHWASESSMTAATARRLPGPRATFCGTDRSGRSETFVYRASERPACRVGRNRSFGSPGGAHPSPGDSGSAGAGIMRP